jgi:hypothetical protein
MYKKENVGLRINLLLQLKATLVRQMYLAADPMLLIS